MSTYSNGVILFLAPKNSDGFFDGTSFNLTGSSPITFINVKAIDDVTNQEALGTLR